MRHFDWRGGALHVEDVPIETIAEAVGTPFYVYSEATLRRHLRAFRDAFAGLDALVAYSAKANANLAVLAIAADEGVGADVVSGGELRRALRAGIAPADIVFSGVGKTAAELDLALEVGVGQINVESENELHLLDRLARARGVRAAIAIRINPDVEAGGHAKISTGKAEDKFGVPAAAAEALYARAAQMDGIRIAGVAMHIGSQIAALDPFEAAFRRATDLVASLRAQGIGISVLDVGGGLAAPYDPAEPAPPSPADYAALVRRIAAPLGLRIVVEPGRAVAGNAGALVARVVYVKTGASRRFVILDAGMNDLLRPALYDAWHEIVPVRAPAPDAPLAPYDVVGPVCETGDRFASDRLLAPLADGDLVAIMTAGAYGASLSSAYNARPLAPEVLASGDRFDIVRARPDFEASVAGETIPPRLQGRARSAR